MSTSSLGAEISALAARVDGPVLVPGDEGFDAEITPFNLALTHSPDVVVGATSTDDVAEAVRFAEALGLPVNAFAAGHGDAPVNAGVIISTKRLDAVRIDPAARIATVGGGTQWRAVVAAAAEHGLAPITGASGVVGVVGFLLGGGVGPLARSHGFGSDRLRGATVVTGGGVVVDTDDHPDLLWALRGGRAGLGVVTEARVALVELATLYGGALFFDEPQIDAAFRAYVDWTAGTDPQVTTSAAIVRFPPFDVVPEPLRGRRMLSLRFAYPGPTAEGERLAAPLRAFAPIHLDALGELPAAEIARIHNDPTEPAPSWVSGSMLAAVDQDFATAYLAAAEASPFIAVEIRQLGEATTRDVPEGSAVGGRAGAFTLGVVAADPSTFAGAQAAFDALKSAVAPWISPHTTVNFIGVPRSAEQWASAWDADTFAKLAVVRRRYDPERVFPTPY